MLRKRKFNPDKVKTIGVFVGEDLLGDGILKFPFVCALRSCFPQAHITWISGHKKSIYSSILAPLVQGKIDCVVDKKQIGTSWTEIFSPKFSSFDLFINTHKNLKTSLILKAGGSHYFLDSLHGFFLSYVQLDFS